VVGKGKKRRCVAMQIRLGKVVMDVSGNVTDRTTVAYIRAKRYVADLETYLECRADGKFTDRTVMLILSRRSSARGHPISSRTALADERR